MEKHKKQLGISESTLTIIAMITMCIDHLGVKHLITYSYARIIGRIAFPIYVYMIIQGVHHTRDIKKYTERLFILALLSEIPYNLLGSGRLINLRSQNVIFELLLCVFVVNIIKQYKSNKTETIKGFILVCTAFWLSEYLRFDYGIHGILLAIAFELVYDTKYEKASIAPILAIIFGIAYKSYQILGYVLELQTYSILSAIPIVLYNKDKGIDTKAFRAIKYGFYPFHMVIIIILKEMIT